MSLDGAYTLAEENFIVVYDSRFACTAVYGHVGGVEPRQLMRPISNTCLASSTFSCPACGCKVASGQLLCLACSAVFLFRGEGRYYSPILNEFVCLAEKEDIARTITISRKLATRFLLCGQLVNRRSPLAMLQIIFENCIRQLVRWQSDREWGEQTKLEGPQRGAPLLGAEDGALGLCIWHAAVH